jgi:hypothetical protein
MRGGKRLSLEQIKEFLEGSQEWQFEAQQREQIYEWVSGVLRQQGYAQQGRGAKGLLRRYLAKMSARLPAHVDVIAPMPIKRVQQALERADDETLLFIERSYDGGKDSVEALSSIRHPASGNRGLRVSLVWHAVIVALRSQGERPIVSGISGEGLS